MAIPTSFYSGDLAGLSTAENAANQTALAEREAGQRYMLGLRQLQTQDQGQRSNERIAGTQAQGARDVAGINADASKYGSSTRLQADLNNSARMLQIATMNHDNEVRALIQQEQESGRVDTRERRRLDLQERQLRDATDNFKLELQSREKIADLNSRASNPRVLDQVIKQLPEAQAMDAQAQAEADDLNAKLDKANKGITPDSYKTMRFISGNPVYGLTAPESIYAPLTVDQKTRVAIAGGRFAPRVKSYADNLMAIAGGGRGAAPYGPLPPTRSDLSVTDYGAQPVTFTPVTPPAQGIPEAWLNALRAEQGPAPGTLDGLKAWRLKNGR